MALKEFFHDLKQSNPAEYDRITRLAIAACTDIFEFPVRTSDGQPKLLTHDEIRQGHFGGGGLTLNFNDGRPGRTNLCIQLTDLSRAIVEINHFFKSTN